MEKLLIYTIIYPIAGIALLAVGVCLTSRRIPTSWLWLITVAGVFASTVRLFYLSRSEAWGLDLEIFWRAGADLWAGVDPYLPSRFATHRFLNPPSTFPFFALIAALPLKVSVMAWGLINTTLAFGVVLLAKRVVNTHDDREPQKLSYPELGALATAFALADACMATIHLGQLALLATTLILLAIYAQSRNRPVIAGMALGIATMKVGTMLPFLLLFYRRSDLKTWFALAMTVVLLIVLGGHPRRFPDDCKAMLQHIHDLSQPGAVNDISYAGQQRESIIALDHWAYRLGVRNNSILNLIQYCALLLIGLWLAVELVLRRVPPGLGLSLVSLYSLIFLYHRLYDAVMIVPALVYAVGRARASVGRSHLLYAAASILMLMILYSRRNTLGHLTDWVLEHPGVVATLTEWFVLPYSVWSVLLAMACLRLAHIYSEEGSSVPASVASQ